MAQHEKSFSSPSFSTLFFFLFVRSHYLFSSVRHPSSPWLVLLPSLEAGTTDGNASSSFPWFSGGGGRNQTDSHSSYPGAAPVVVTQRGREGERGKTAQESERGIEKLKLRKEDRTRPFLDRHRLPKKYLFFSFSVLLVGQAGVCPRKGRGPFPLREFRENAPKLAGREGREKAGKL